jgi:hypothetical protein
MRGGVFLMGRKLFLLALISLLPHSLAMAQTEEQEKAPSILLQDIQRERSEGYFLLPPGEVMVSAKDDKEMTGPLKYLKSLTVDKIKEESVVADANQEAKYSLRLENSQRIYTFRRKYTLSLNAGLGLVTGTVDPASIYSLFSKNSSQTQAIRSGKDEPLIADKSLFFSLQLRF